MTEISITKGATVDPRLHPFEDAIVRNHLRSSADGQRLAGSQCSHCGTPCFPVRDTCSHCGARAMQELILPAEGLLYSFSTVHVSSSRPVPYTIGYIDLTNGVRLLAPINGDVATLRPDMPMLLQAGDDSFSFVALEKGDRA